MAATETRRRTSAHALHLGEARGTADDVEQSGESGREHTATHRGPPDGGQ